MPPPVIADIMLTYANHKLTTGRDQSPANATNKSRVQDDAKLWRYSGTGSGARNDVDTHYKVFSAKPSPLTLI